MDLTVVRTDDPSGAVLARVGGDLDVTTEAAFTRRAQELGLEAAVRLVVDLTEVTFLDVAGRAALAQLAQHVTDGLGRLALVTLPRNRRLLHVTHLDQLITVFDTVEEGLTWINVDPSLRPRLLASSIGGYQQPLLTPSPRESLGMGFPTSRRRATVRDTTRAEPGRGVARAPAGDLDQLQPQPQPQPQPALRAEPDPLPHGQCPPSATGPGLDRLPTVTAGKGTGAVEPGDWGVLLTPSQVAAMLTVAPKTVTGWANAGLVSSTRTPGGHRRYRQSEIVGLLATGHHPRRVAVALAGSPVTATLPDHGDTRDHADRQTTPTEHEHFVAAAAIAAEAVAIVSRTQATAEAHNVLVVAEAVAAAARTAAEAAEAAREARAAAAQFAATALATNAAHTAAAMQVRADAAAAQQCAAASEAAIVVAAASRPGHQREDALSALRLAAIVEARALATAKDTAADAACVASAVVAAARDVALSVVAAAHALESEVVVAAATVLGTATAAARNVATDTDARASGAAVVARKSAAAVMTMETEHPRRS